MASGTIYGERVIVEHVTESSGSINAGASKTINIDAAKTGYTAVGIVGIHIANNTVFVASGFYINNSQQAHLVIINTGSSSATSNVTADVLYIKN